jgi:hypothetical protein
MEEETQVSEGPYLGEEIFSWTIDEYERHERGPLWYAIASLVGVALVLYSVISQNFLFAVIIIMAGVIIGLSTLREPKKVLFQMTTRGIGVGSSFTPYKSMRSFWIIYEPPMTKNLYIDFGSAITPHLIVPLEDQDPLEVREALLEFLREELTQETEPLSELLGRVLKL